MVSTIVVILQNVPTCALNVIDNDKALFIKQRIIAERFSWLLRVSSIEKMISTKFFIFLLMVTTLDCNNAVLARRLNPRSFFSFYEYDLKSGIIDNHSKDTDDTQNKKIMDDMEKLICKIVYPMPCTNVQLKITLSKSTRKTTVKPKQERAEKNKNENEINYMLRVWDQWNVKDKRRFSHKITFCCL